QALAQCQVVGVTTNAAFLRRLVLTDSFRTANLDTALIEREREALFGKDLVGRDLAVAAAMVHELQHEQTLQSADPFSRRDGWRVSGRYERQFSFAYRGEEFNAGLAYGHDGQTYQVGVGEGESRSEFALQWRALSDDRLELNWGGVRTVVVVHALGEMLSIFTAAGSTQITEVDQLAHAAGGGHEGGRLTAPMPGKVVSFAVKAGEKVSKGQPLAVMEAMKMEHTIAAPSDGTVVELLYVPGDQVTEGAELLRIEVTT
ncbi:MAG: biotin/lipoyl-containing protein, partial [Comamonas sp.]